MTRYYYDCPLEAAYMYKNFGIAIQGYGPDNHDLKLCYQYGVGLLEGKKLYTKESSELLLEPRLGFFEKADDTEGAPNLEKADLIEVEFAGSFAIGYVVTSSDGKYYYLWDSGGNLSDEGYTPVSMRIMERNDKPFFIPKKEI